MSINKPNSQKSFNNGQGKDTKKVSKTKADFQNDQLLKKYIESTPFVDIREQQVIAASFDVKYKRRTFSDIYRQRYYDLLLKEPITRLNASTITGIPEKLLCFFKLYYQNKNMIEVERLDVCPISGSKGVQFLTTNPKLFKDS